MQHEASPAQRIISWLALVLQGERGPLGRSVQYKHTSSGMILLQWAGGPTARETAQRLHSAADPELPITEITYPSPDKTRLSVAGVTVCLQACDPEPGARPLSVDDDQPGQAETNVLRWRGVAIQVSCVACSRTRKPTA